MAPRSILWAATVAWLLASGLTRAAQPLTYPIVDTGQTTCYDTQRHIDPPRSGEAFHGQDAQFAGHQPTYRDLGNGTVEDRVTGLVWVQACGEKVTWSEASAGAAACRVGAHDDWRLPTIKELYSLILFSGVDPSGPSGAPPVPFLDTRCFEFRYGDVGAHAGRLIDAQYWSATRYVGRSRMAQVFGVNFADGRIKGYPDSRPGGGAMRQYVRYVRGRLDYGVNRFRDRRDGTIADEATGLQWSRTDSAVGLTWPDALAWVAQQNAAGTLGHRDWRLPNAKELQSLVDYSRAPDSTRSAAIDPLFQCTAITDEGGQTNYPCYWTSTTHASTRGDGAAVYVAFGEALGWMERPPGSGRRTLEDVHGAGAQRSDPKDGRAADYPFGRGPQGDVVRVLNFARLVRDLP